MNNFEAMVKAMTIERAAVDMVKLVLINNREPYYVTTTGQLFPYDKFEEAVKMQYAFLSSDAPAEEATQGEVNEEDKNTAHYTEAQA